MRAWTLLAGASALLSACVALDDFETGIDERFEGYVLGQDGDCDAGPCSFIRRGFAAGTRLTMSFDPEVREGEAGRLSTRAADGSLEACGTTLDDEPLMPIIPLQHDQLSLYDFPGNGRLRNFVYALRPLSGPLAGRDVVAFVSLLSGRKVEVRLLSGSGAVSCSPNDCTPYQNGECDFYGVFTMQLARGAP